MPDNWPPCSRLPARTGDNCDAICQVLASEDRHISPTRFHNSVHNVSAGYWGIASGAMTPATALCAYDGSFGAGLLEALTQVAVDGVGTLLVTYEAPYPEPLHAKRPLPAAFGLALVLMPQPGPHSLAHLQVDLVEAPVDRVTNRGPGGPAPPDPLGARPAPAAGAGPGPCRSGDPGVPGAAQPGRGCPAMPLDHAWLLAHLPHQGTMCLLDHIDAWDAQRDPLHGHEPSRPE